MEYISEKNRHTEKSREQFDERVRSFAEKHNISLEEARQRYALEVDAAFGEVSSDEQGEAFGSQSTTRQTFRAAEKQIALETAQRESVTDPLTGVNNRGKFDKDIERLMDSLQRAPEDEQREGYEKKHFLAILDIDHFKRINDTYGHGAGDTALKCFAQKLGEVTRQEQIYRYGGEEFVVMFEAQDAFEAEVIAERLRAAIADISIGEVKTNDGTPLTFTVSIGVSEIDKEKSVEDVKREADTALYQSKHGGRNKVTFFIE